MNLIRNLSIRNKLLLVSLVPLLALAYFLAVDITTGISDKHRVQLVYDDVVRAEAISNVVHQVQQERGYSLGYVLSTGKEEKNELFSQREQTDKAIFELRKVLVRQDTGRQVQELLNNLPALRAAINSYKTNPDSIRDAFGQLNNALIDEVNKTALYSRSPEVKNHLNAHMFMLHGKEHFGQLRASLKQAILSGGFKGNGFAEFASLKGRHEENLENFRRNASDELTAFYNKKNTEPNNVQGT